MFADPKCGLLDRGGDDANFREGPENRGDMMVAGRGN
jgi:hypothetical protein